MTLTHTCLCSLVGCDTPFPFLSNSRHFLYTKVTDASADIMNERRSQHSPLIDELREEHDRQILELRSAHARDLTEQLEAARKAVIFAKNQERKEAVAWAREEERSRLACAVSFGEHVEKFVREAVGRCIGSDGYREAVESLFVGMTERERQDPVYRYLDDRMTGVFDQMEEQREATATALARAQEEIALLKQAHQATSVCANSLRNMVGANGDTAGMFSRTIPRLVGRIERLERQLR